MAVITQKGYAAFFFRGGPLWFKFILDKEFSENVFVLEIRRF